VSNDYAAGGGGVAAGAVVKRGCSIGDTVGAAVGVAAYRDTVEGLLAASMVITVEAKLFSGQSHG
jgi:hypothetical protein